MSIRPPMIALLFGAMWMAGGCESAFDYYPHHEDGVACSDIHKGTEPGDYGGFSNHFTSSTAGTNPATGPATKG
jgi:hypothetical protein